MAKAVTSPNEMITKDVPSPTAQSVLREWGDSCTQELFPQWRDLAARGVCAEPFYQPEWFQAFHANLAPNAHPLLVATYHGGNLIGVLPLMRTRSVLGRIPAITLQSFSNLHSCRFDLVHEGNAQGRVAEATWRCLSGNEEWDAIEARDVPTRGNFEALMRQAQADGFPTLMWPTRRMPYLPLPQDGEDPFKNCPERFKGTRTRLKTKERKLRQEAALDFTLSKKADPKILSQFFELERAGWKGKNGSAIALSGPLVSFYTTIAKIAEKQGSLRLYSLNLGGNPIAMHFGLQMNGTYYIPKVAYDERFKKFSPGLILAKYVIEALTRERVTCFDFLGPRMEWKCVWTPYVRDHSNCYIFNRTIKGRALKAALQIGGHLRNLKYRIKGDPQEI